MPRLAPFSALPACALLVAVPAGASLLKPFSPLFFLGDALAHAEQGLDGRGNLVFASIRLQGNCAVQRFHVSGRALGPAVPVPECDGAIRLGLAVSPRGPFLLSFMPPAPPADLRHAWILFDAEGERVASGSLPAGPLDELRAAYDDEGRVGLVRTSGASFHQVILSVIDPQGGSVLEERVVTDTGLLAGVIAQGEGVFLVTWHGILGPSVLRHAQRIDVAGQALGPVFYPPGTLLAGDGCGRLTAAGIAGGAWLQRLSPEGAPLRPRLSVETRPVAQLLALTCDGPGNCLLASRLQQPDAGSQSWARRLDAAGVPDGPAFPVSSGLPDMLTQVLGGRGGHVLLTSSPHLPWAPLYGAIWSTPPKGDFDADQRADLALRDLTRGDTRLWTMVEGVRTSNPLVWPPTPDADWALVGVDDFDGDRRQDLLFRRFDGELRFVLLGGAGHESLGASPLWGARSPGPAWRLEATGDFDGDGWADLFFRQELTGELTVWRLRGMRFAGRLGLTPAVSPGPAWRVAAAGDWDGDGRLDLLWSRADTGALVQWLLDAELRRTAERPLDPPQASSPDWRVVAAGDYGVGPGGEGFTQDIVWRHAVSGRQVIWFLDRAGHRSAGVFTSPAAPGDATGWAVEGPR